MQLQGHWRGSLSREPIYLLSDHQHACTLRQDVVRNVLIECWSVVSNPLLGWIDCFAVDRNLRWSMKLNLELRERNLVISMQILFDDSPGEVSGFQSLEINF